MDFWKKTRSFYVVFALLPAIVPPTYCEQLNLQAWMLPAAPMVAVTVEPAAPLYKPENAPLATELLQKRSAVDQLMLRSDQHFQKGRFFYQAKDTQAARKEFDTAIDLMLQASELNPERQVFEKRLDEMVEAIHRYDLAGLGSADQSSEVSFEKAPLEDILEMTFPVDPKLKLKVREQLMATVSQLPLSVNDHVLGYIRYFSSPKGRATLLAGMRRAGRYRPLVQRILDEEGLPQELIFLAQAESGFLSRAVSRKAAGGMWQFMPARGREYGLTQNAGIDERFDPEKSTRAAARHLRDLYRSFGDWYLAIAAYNCGPGTVEKAVERSGYADFWELRARRLLPAETTNYVPIILAFTIMTKNAEAYDLTDVVPDDPIEYDTIEIEAPTHLALIGDLTDMPLSELISLNPAVLKSIAPKGYLLRVPKGGGTLLAASLQMIPAERRATWRIHTVAGGETLASIGKRYGASAANIVATNNLDSAEASEGDRLLIPAVAKSSSGAVKKSRASSRRSSVSSSKTVHTSPQALTRTASSKRNRG